MIHRHSSAIFFSIILPYLIVDLKLATEPYIRYNGYGKFFKKG